MSKNLFYRFLFALIALGGLFACTINVGTNANSNVNSNVAKAPAHPTAAPASNIPATSSPVASSGKTPWTVAVCSSRAAEVTLQAGPDKNDSQTFAIWKTGGTQKIYPLPARVQNLSEIYFQAIGSDAGAVELCVLYDGQPKQRIAIEGGSEDHTIKSGDGENDCRCTE